MTQTYLWRWKELVSRKWNNSAKYDLTLFATGSSFGIVTEFLYRIYRGPETLPTLVPLLLKRPSDLRRIAKLNSKWRYNVSLYRLYHYRKLSPSFDHVVSVNFSQSSWPNFPRNLVFLRNRTMGSWLSPLPSSVLPTNCRLSQSELSWLTSNQRMGEQMPEKLCEPLKKPASAFRRAPQPNFWGQGYDLTKGPNFIFIFPLAHWVW